MSFERLGNVVDVQSGFAFRSNEYTGNGIRVIRIADVQRGKLEASKPVFIRADRETEFLQYSVGVGDLLMSLTGNVGRVAMVPEDIGPAVLNQRVVKLEPNSSALHGRYLFHYLNSNAFLQRATAAAQGVAQKNLSMRWVADHEIFLPTLTQQKKIVAVLDRAGELRQACEKSISELDRLGQSVFLDMFGDPSQEWHRKPIADLAVPGPLGMRTGPFGSDLLKSEFVDSGIKVLGIDNVVNNSFSEIYSRYITSEKYEQLKRYSVQPGDVLVSIMGTCGRCAIAPENLGTAINTKHLCCITLNQGECLPEFLHAYFLQSRSAQRYLQSRARGAIMTGLNMGIIKAMPVEIPPMPLQVEFSKKLKVISRLHTNIRKQLQEVTSLFDSIQAQAFSGEI